MHHSYLHIDLFTDLGLWGFSYQFWPWLAEEVRLLCQARCQRRGRMEKKGGWRRERKWFVQIASVRQRKVVQRVVSQRRFILDLSPPIRGCSISITVSIKLLVEPGLLCAYAAVVVTFARNTTPEVTDQVTQEVKNGWWNNASSRFSPWWDK